MGWGKQRIEIGPWNCSWAGFLSGCVADNRAMGWVDSSELRKWEKSCSADGEFHSWSKNALPLSLSSCNQNSVFASVLSHCHSWIWDFPRPFPCSAFPTMAQLGLGCSALAAFEVVCCFFFGKFDPICCISSQNSSYIFFYWRTVATPVFWL